jgi:hypothetical protein
LGLCGIYFGAIFWICNLYNRMGRIRLERQPMEFNKEYYDKALEFVEIQANNGKDGEQDLAYYVAMVWTADEDMMLEDLGIL